MNADVFAGRWTYWDFEDALRAGNSRARYWGFKFRVYKRGVWIVEAAASDT